MDEGKTCTKCNQWKPLSEFGRDKSCKGGYRPECKTCRNAKAKATLDANPERRARRYAESRRWHATNPDYSKQKSAEWAAENPERIKEHEKNRDKEKQK